MSEAPGSTQRGLERFAPIAGLAFAAILAASFVGLFAGGAEPDDAFASVARTITGERSGLLVRYAFNLAGGGLFIVYIASLTSALRRAAGPQAMLPVLAFGSGLVGVTLGVITNAINAALAASVASVSGDGAVWAVFQAGQAMFTFAAMFLGLFLVAASEVVRRTGLIPRWIGWAGLVGGLAYVVGSFSVADQRGPLALPAVLGFAVLTLWVALTSVLLVRPIRIDRDLPSR